MNILNIIAATKKGQFGFKEGLIHVQQAMNNFT